MIILKMAWRNIGRNRRRSLLTISAIGLGLAVLLFHQSLVTGFQKKMIENSVRLHSGHIQIHREGYQRHKKVELMIKDPSSVASVLKGMKGVVFSKRVNFRGLVSSAENSSGIQVYGVDPDREERITVIRRKILEGGYLSGGDRRAILIGDMLAEDLGVGVGDKVVIMTQAVDGSLSAELFRVKGIFRTGSPIFDEGVGYITTKAAQDLLGMDGAVSEFVVLLEEGADLDGIMRALRASPALKGLEVLSWKDLSPRLVQIIELQSAVLLIILIVIFSIVALGIVNTLLMSVMERVREFGIMMALGARPSHVVSLVLVEAFYLGILGLVAGVIIGFSVVYYFSAEGIDLSAFSEATATLLPVEKVIYPAFNPRFTAISSAAVVITSLLTSVYPAMRAARLKPAEALRHV